MPGVIASTSGRWKRSCSSTRWPASKSARKVLIAHNVETLIWQRYHETEGNLLKRWYIKQQWRKFERFERRAFTATTKVVAVSENDARLIRGQSGGRDVHVVDNGIDRLHYEEVRPDADHGTILFLGSLDWRPNLDAIGLLLDWIFPVVRRGARGPAAPGRSQAASGACSEGTRNSGR